MDIYMCEEVYALPKKRYSVTAAVIDCAAIDLGITVGCFGVSWL